MTHDPHADERLARIQARSAAHRDELAHRRPTPTSPDRARGPARRHAAKGSRGAALALSAVSTLGLAGWFHQVASATSSGTAATSGTATTGATTTSLTGGTATTASTTTASSPTASSSTGTALADGTYTGAAASTRYGPVQVEITVRAGRITGVDVVAYPSSDRKSASINASAVPTLVEETLTSQSADVDSVSGATYTSTGYETSLQSAIDAATQAAAS